MRPIKKISKLYFMLKMLWLFNILLLNSLMVPLNDALIVPKELPSILSVVYSNIPPIKKGTDSRLGFGFRLGEHADFQIIMELGPQIETRPIGNQEQRNSFNKRQVNLKDQGRIIKEEATKQDKLATTTIVNAKDDWLEKWKGLVQKLKYIEKNGQGELRKLPKRPYVPEETLKQLQLLYKMATSTTSTAIIQNNQNNSIRPTGPTIISTTTTLKEVATPGSIQNDHLESLTINTMTLSSEMQEALQFLKEKFQNNDIQDLYENNIKTKSDITRELTNVNLGE